MSYFKSTYTLVKPNQISHGLILSTLKEHIDRVTTLQYKEETLLGASCSLNRVIQIQLLYYVTQLIYLDMTDMAYYNILNSIEVKWSYFESKYPIAKVINVAKCLDIDYMKEVIDVIFYYDGTNISLSDDRWILATGRWNDSGIWIDEARWIDG